MRLVACLVAKMVVVSANANDLNTAISSVQTACAGIAEEINNLKKSEIIIKKVPNWGFFFIYAILTF